MTEQQLENAERGDTSRMEALVETIRDLRRHREELLAANNAELDKRRKAEADLAAARAEVERLKSLLPCGHIAANLETVSLGSGETDSYCNFCLQIHNETERLTRENEALRKEHEATVPIEARLQYEDLSRHDYIVPVFSKAHRAAQAALEGK